AFGDNLISEFLYSQLVAPIPKRALGELHYVAFVHQGNRRAAEVERVLNRSSHQAFCSGRRNGFYADTAVGPDFVAEFLIQQRDDFLSAVGSRSELDSRVDVLGVLSKDHDVDIFWLLDWRRHAFEVPNRANAGV